jgi:flagellar biosynthesis protein FlhF
MRIKSYFVSSVNQAIAQATAELGEDALLLRTRQTDGGYEVVFGCEDGEHVPSKSQSASEDSGRAPLADARGSEAPTEPRPSGSGAKSVLTRIFTRATPNVAEATKSVESPDPHSLESIRAEIDEIRRLLVTTDRPRARVSELAEVFDRLTGAGIDDTLAHQIVDAVEAGMATHALAKLRGALGLGARRFDLQRFEELLRTELETRIQIDPNLGAGGSEGTVVALVGPGGAGKTTTLMKIAAFQAAPDRAVRILTLDHASLASRMHLKLFANKAGVAFTALESPESLSSFLENARRTEIVLIDTPSCASDADREKLAGILNDCPGIDTHLVAPAYMTGPALRRAIAKYAVFKPSKIIITKLDESPTFGAAISEAVRASLSISLLTNGTSIPNDLHAASVDDLLAIACARDEIRAACA